MMIQCPVTFHSLHGMGWVDVVILVQLHRYLNDDEVYLDSRVDETSLVILDELFLFYKANCASILLLYVAQNNSKNIGFVYHVGTDDTFWVGQHG